MNLNSVMIGSQDPGKLASYYTELFGKPAWESDEFRGWQLGLGTLMVGPHDQVSGANGQPGRIIWNVETDDVRGAFEQLKAAGGIVVREPYNPAADGEALIATFADPDDNYFQLVSPM